MSEYTLESIRDALHLKQKKLQRDIVDLKELVQPEAPDSAIGRVSRMDAINNRSINEAALRKKKMQLSKIENALIEIKQTTFGKCIRCGKSIQLARILLMPESKVCVNCAR
ncbi:MAG: TraR/DksA family transcriptional regulator [Prolixibacteraceae bacterium]